MKQLILASGSPRRAKILAAAGVEFKVVKTEAAEISLPNDPAGTVRTNALAKLRAALPSAEPVLAADTIVWFNNKIYGKPKNYAEAKTFLQELAGQTHTVFTGVAYYDAQREWTEVALSNVTFKSLSDVEIDNYIELAKPLDRAGAYDIDEHGAMIVDHFEGEYENIMGLPLMPLKGWHILEK